MASSFKINVILQSEKKTSFSDIKYGKEYKNELNGIKLTVSKDFPAKVTIIPSDINDPVKSIEYNLYSDIKNYHKVIIPESGRWYINMTNMVSFWRLNKESAINDFKMPIYIFTGQDLNMDMTFGVIGRNYETTFTTLEPKVNRALIVYMRKLSIQIKRGTDLYPIPESLLRMEPDGSIVEYLYYRTSKDVPNQPWLLTLRDFSNFQKKFYNIPDMTTEGSLYPLWCSWTDWFSDNVTDEVIVNNVKQGVKLGIKNYIIDDGWFGPGLDNDFSVKLNIGDWMPDPMKIKNMNKLVKDVKKEGGVPLIWCAPHAVAPDANCFNERKKYLIMNKDGEILITANKFHSLCFMCPEAREIMADICTGFIKKWGFEGAKYDLFNCIPNMNCTNPEHTHDVTSMMEGLEKTLELIDKKSRDINKNYIVELKQNYGTPFLAQYGSMTRAGDTPYNTEGNFLRTLYIQGYSPYSVNDYQTITNEDSPEAVACIILKMMTVGIPSYSINFDRLNQCNKDVIKNYNDWYNDNIKIFHNFRIPLDGENNVFKIPEKEKDYFFLVNDGGNLKIEKSSIILNATFKRDIFINTKIKKKAKISVFDCFGKLSVDKETDLKDWTHIDVLPGSMIKINLIND